MSTPLLLAQDVIDQIHLVIGSNPLANARCTKIIEAGARPIIIAPPDTPIHSALQEKIDQGQVGWIKRQFKDQDIQQLGRDAVDNVVDAVFITLGGQNPLSVHIAALCRRLRVPINVTDAPDLCSFTLLVTHSDGPLHIGITTSGQGCKLASRLRREVAALFPPNFGDAINRLGTMRRRIWDEDRRLLEFPDINVENSEDDASAQKSTFNQLVTESNQTAARTRRMRWLSQIYEYWPLRRLAAISDSDIDSILQSYTATNSTLNPPPSHLSDPDPDLDLHVPPPGPLVILAGSGPGSPHLLTMATHRAIQIASVILADKLVPAPVLDLIPRRTPVHIARKFPGNADAAQQELLELGLANLAKGLTVLRLKQGDPYVYGRGGEEYVFFQRHGYRPIVLPGITSSLSAPLFAAIPPTHRSVADQVLICTGTGRQGAAPPPPPYVPTQTVVFLMALHRLASLVASLTAPTLAATSVPDAAAPTTSSAAPVPPSSSLSTWPIATPCAVIERASCPDQRVIRTTLQHVVAAVDELGSRPPGLLVVGWSCEVLQQRVGGAAWVVEEGFQGLDEVMDGMMGGVGADTETAGLGLGLGLGLGVEVVAGAGLAGD